MTGLTIKIGILDNADGSSQIYMNNYGAICSVIGPAPIKSRLELIDRATIDVNVQAIGKPPSLIEVGIASRIKRIMERVILGHFHPRSLISINIQPLKVSKMVNMAVLLNACFAALYDAAIPMNGLYVAIPLALNNDNEDEFDWWCVTEVHNNSIIDARIRSLSELGNIALKSNHIMEQMKQILIQQ